MRWTLDLLKIEAKKYNSKGEFNKNMPGAYRASNRLGIYSDVTSHMNRLYVKAWVPDTIIEQSLQYDSLQDFIQTNKSAYNAAIKYGIIDEVTKHMSRKHENWTVSKVEKEALKYSTRGDFQIKSSNAYQAAARLGVLDSVCGHMEPGLYGFNQRENAILYCFSINTNHSFVYKIGVTNSTVEYRYRWDKIDDINYGEPLTFKLDTGAEALEIETEIKKNYSNLLYKGHEKFFKQTGNTEVFTQDVLTKYIEDTG